MSPLILVAAAVVIAAALLVFAADLLAAIAFHYLPALEGTVLAFTASDFVRLLRAMPALPKWWPGLQSDMHKPILVAFAQNPLNGMDIC